MWNSVCYNEPFYNRRVLGGYSNADYDSHKILYAGPDPAEPGIVLIRKLLHISRETYAYEETRITRVEGNQPTVHTQVYRLKGFDLEEKLDAYEVLMRSAHRPIPNVLGFSIFYK